MAARYSVAELVNLLRGVSIGNEFNREASTIDAKRVRYIESDDSEGEEDDESVMRRGVRRYRGRDVDSDDESGEATSAGEWLAPSRRLLVLVACESSHEVSSRFRNLGHEAYSCDLLPADNPKDARWHIQDDALKVIHWKKWDLVIAHPPCTYLCSAGLHWKDSKLKDGTLRYPDREKCTDEAAKFFMEFTKLDCHWAIENPVGCMSTRYRKPDQYIQPYEYGSNASKQTGLWLHKLPKLVPTERAEPVAWVKSEKTGKMLPRYANQTPEYDTQNKVPRGTKRSEVWKWRSKTWPGVADAMADQWSNYILSLD